VSYDEEPEAEDMSVSSYMKPKRKNLGDLETSAKHLLGHEAVSERTWTKDDKPLAFDKVHHTLLCIVDTRTVGQWALARGARQESGTSRSHGQAARSRVWQDSQPAPARGTL